MMHKTKPVGASLKINQLVLLLWTHSGQTRRKKTIVAWSKSDLLHKTSSPLASKIASLPNGKLIG